MQISRFSCNTGKSFSFGICFLTALKYQVKRILFPTLPVHMCPNFIETISHQIPIFKIIGLITKPYTHIQQERLLKL